ncbi:hypothetical protein NPIL_154461, partial [Nephila pilipes]
PNAIPMGIGVRSIPSLLGYYDVFPLLVFTNRILLHVFSQLHGSSLPLPTTYCLPIAYGQFALVVGPFIRYFLNSTQLLPCLT